MGVLSKIQDLSGTDISKVNKKMDSLQVLEELQTRIDTQLNGEYSFVVEDIKDGIDRLMSILDSFDANANDIKKFIGSQITKIKLSNNNIDSNSISNGNEKQTSQNINHVQQQ